MGPTYEKVDDTPMFSMHDGSKPNLVVDKIINEPNLSRWGGFCNTLNPHITLTITTSKPSLKGGNSLFNFMQVLMISNAL